MECGAEEVVEVNCVRGGDPGACAAVLKRKLDLYCAAVAKSMETKPQESSFGCPTSQASDALQLFSQASFDGTYKLHSRIHIGISSNLSKITPEVYPPGSYQKEAVS